MVVLVLGELERAILESVWAHDRPVTCREVLEDLKGKRSIAYTTVLTVMDRLRRKGMLSKELAGRAHTYQAVQSRETYTASLMVSVRGAAADPSTVLLRFAEQLPASEAARLRDLLDDAERPGEALS